MPGTKRYGRPGTHILREILEAVFYLLKSGCQWRLLLHDFPVLALLRVACVVGAGRVSARRTGFVQESSEVPEQAGEPLQLLLAHTLHQVGLYLGQAPGDDGAPPVPGGDRAGGRRGPATLVDWQSALYAFVLLLACVFLVPLTKFWWPNPRRPSWGRLFLSGRE